MKNARPMVNKNYRVGAIGLVAVFVSFFAASTPARAAFVYNIYEVGSDVQMDGEGGLNISSLTKGSAGSATGVIASGFGAVLGGNGNVVIMTGFSGPTSFGSSTSFTLASISSGFALGVFPTLGQLRVPESYNPPTSGPSAYFSNSTTWTGQSLSSLGLTLGTSATWTWGSGGNADSLTINVIAVPAPEPSTWALLAIAGGMGLMWRRRREKIMNCEL